MPITTDASLISRFDMLFTREMKEYVKSKGGASYLRGLVFQDLASAIGKGEHLAMEPHTRYLTVTAYNREMERRGTM